VVVQDHSAQKTNNCAQKIAARALPSRSRWGLRAPDPASQSFSFCDFQQNFFFF